MLDHFCYILVHIYSDSSFQFTVCYILGVDAVKGAFLSSKLGKGTWCWHIPAYPAQGKAGHAETIKIFWQKPSPAKDLRKSGELVPLLRWVISCFPWKSTRRVKHHFTPVKTKCALIFHSWGRLSGAGSQSTCSQIPGRSEQKGCACEFLLSEERKKIKDCLQSSLMMCVFP